jgi:hypothetical protein
MIIYLLILVLLVVSLRKQRAQEKPTSPQIAQGRGSPSDDVETIIDRLEWANSVNSRTAFHWRILIVSIVCSTIALMVFNKQSPSPLILLQIILILFTLLYSAHKYYERHHEIFARVYTQDNLIRLRERIGGKNSRQRTPPIVADKMPADSDVFWFLD